MATLPPVESRYKGSAILSFEPLDPDSPYAKSQRFAAGVKKWARAAEHIDSIIEFLVDNVEEEGVYEALQAFVEVLDNSPILATVRSNFGK
jgi:hypothetical protein